MNLIFCGTPQFAVPTLEKLVAEKFSIQLVVTNPDEPRDRGHKVQPSPVKESALKHGLALYQPVKVRAEEAREFLTNFHPDAIVIVAYGQIVPQWMIDIPPLGCINLHASLLPKYRGAAPIAWAIIRGETETGVTTMKIDAGMDTGDMLLERREPIRAGDTTETLGERLSVMGADLMVETLRKLERGDIKPRPQDHAQATLAPRLKKEDGLINWSMPAEELERRVRGLIPWPGAYTSFRAKKLRIWRADVAAADSEPVPAPGTILVKAGRLAVACGGETQLLLHEVQMEGRKRVSARDFINGSRVQSGEKLGF